MNATHKLVRIETFTDAEYAALSWQEKRTFEKSPAVWKAPTLPKFIPAPDYSTHAKVTARCLERGTGAGADIRAAAKDTEFRNLYRELRAVAAPVAVRAEDLHRSRWRVIRRAATFDGRGFEVTPAQWDLTDEPLSTPAPRAQKRKRSKAA